VLRVGGGDCSGLDRDAPAGQQLQTELQDQGLNSQFLALELGVPENCQAAVERIVEAHGRLDVLVRSSESCFDMKESS